MDKQMTISAFSDELAQVRTKKKEFLSQIEWIVPWKEWLTMIQPCYYKGERGPVPHLPDGRFLLTIRRDPDGSIHNDSYEIIPCCVSSDLAAAAAKRDMYNNYQPTPYEPGTEAYDRAMSKITGTYEGKDLSTDYSNFFASE